MMSLPYMLSINMLRVFRERNGKCQFNLPDCVYQIFEHTFDLTIVCIIESVCKKFWRQHILEDVLLICIAVALDAVVHMVGILGEGVHVLDSWHLPVMNYVCATSMPRHGRSFM